MLDIERTMSLDLLAGQATRFGFGLFGSLSLGLWQRHGFLYQAKWSCLNQPIAASFSNGCYDVEELRFRLELINERSDHMF